MADEEDVDVDEAPEPKKKSPIILIVVLVLVTIAICVGVAAFITTTLMSNAAIEQANSPAAMHHDPGVFKQLGDEKEGILVNVGGQKAGKFLKTKIILELNPGKKDVVVEGVVSPVADTKMMDTVLQVLRSSKLDEFDASKQDELKKKIKEEINGVLGEGTVYDVYITSFLLQ
ncbi:MAG: flagellar basal body-associated FliL family protein [Selenomonadaceae bacterium]|nr:flagellar basal body-associated FliL family protein [Selenomonadaceae bacterium]MBR3723249.1 flagellar basal body-associated FliL family protein [Selenomonadaceae bacterium]